MHEQYNTLIGRCVTMNQVNQVHIAFSNSMTPGEVMAFADTLYVPGRHELPVLNPDRRFSLDELRDNARNWMRNHVRDLTAVGKPDPEPFLRRELHKHATLFGDGRPPEGKILLLSLPGANYRMMMSVPSFLQNLDASKVDLVILRDGTRSRYLQGIEGMTDSIRGLAEVLPEWLDFADYRRVCGLGISAGGLPMMLVGLWTGIDDMLLVGPASPFDPRWNEPGGLDPAEVLRSAAADGRQRRIVVAFGADCDEDRVYAREIRELLDVEVVEVSDPHEKVGHPALHPLALRGELAPFLTRHLRLDE